MSRTYRFLVTITNGRDVRTIDVIATDSDHVRRLLAYDRVWWIKKIHLNWN